MHAQNETTKGRFEKKCSAQFLFRRGVTIPTLRIFSPTPGVVYLRFAYDTCVARRCCCWVLQLHFAHSLIIHIPHSPVAGYFFSIFLSAFSIVAAVLPSPCANNSKAVNFLWSILAYKRCDAMQCKKTKITTPGPLHSPVACMCLFSIKNNAKKSIAASSYCCSGVSPSFLCPHRTHACVDYANSSGKR